MGIFTWYKGIQCCRTGTAASTCKRLLCSGRLHTVTDTEQEPGAHGREKLIIVYKYKCLFCMLFYHVTPYELLTHFDIKKGKIMLIILI